MTEENSMSDWFQDNLRIIISVGIVILLVFAIYSYSKRNSRVDVVVDDSQIEEVAMTAGNESDAEINEIIDEIKDEKTTPTDTDLVDTITEDKATEQIERKHAEEEASTIAAKVEMTKEAEKQKVAVEQEKQSAKDVVKEVIESRSRQKEGVTVIVAFPGDSKTTMARKAAAEYMTANNISGLTPAHKIYIEDYIQKATNTNGIHPGTKLEFSNTLIDSAIENSRTLTSVQLSNLDKYAQNVSIL